MVVFLQSTSPSPALSLVNRVLPVEVMGSTALASPKTAAAVALQKSQSNPRHTPFASGAANPGSPVVTTHRSLPRALTSCSVLEWPPAKSSDPKKIMVSDKINIALIIISSESVIELI